MSRKKKKNSLFDFFMRWSLRTNGCLVRCCLFLPGEFANFALVVPGREKRADFASFLADNAAESSGEKSAVALLRESQA